MLEECPTLLFHIEWLYIAVYGIIGRKVNIVRPFCNTVNLLVSLSLRYDVLTMLRILSSPGAAYPRIHIDGVPVKAWIEHKPWQYGSTDWQLWFERGGRLARGKCQLRLEIESKLKAWLLQRCGVPLSTLSYEELHLIAGGKVPEALRLHARGLNTLTPQVDKPAHPLRLPGLERRCEQQLLVGAAALIAPHPSHLRPSSFLASRRIPPPLLSPSIFTVYAPPPI